MVIKDKRGTRSNMQMKAKKILHYFFSLCLLWSAFLPLLAEVAAEEVSENSSPSVPGASSENEVEPTQVQTPETSTRKIIIESDSHDKFMSPIDEFNTFKSERVSQKKLKDPQRQTLADVLKDQVGVESQAYCANCGAKRLTINGLKGEHTSLLIDGLPLLSAISSLYGVDNIPVNGLQDIYVMRGAGASLINPEAIGGTIDIITIDPLKGLKTFSTSLTSNDRFSLSGQNHTFMVSLPSADKRWGVSFGGQFAGQETWDEDGNGVAESPQRENFNGLVKLRFVPNKKNDFNFRVGVSQLEILGGPVNPVRPKERPDPQVNSADFLNQDVNQQYIGDPLRITDWVSLKRYESALSWKHLLNSTDSLNFKTGFAYQGQDSIYQHGYDYFTDDQLFVTDFSYEKFINEDHILKFGVFNKLQNFQSESDFLYNERGYDSDRFMHSSAAGYAQWTHLVSHHLEYDLALRADSIYIDWKDLDNKIYEVVLAPRFQLRHEFNHHLSQRLSYGLGYRTPLTFLESQHGNNENGFVVNITDLEKAQSLVYSLSYNTPTYYLTGGVHYTRLKNMAFGFESIGNATEYRNTNETYDIFATDILAGYQINPSWMLEASLEFFNYEPGYKLKLPTAAIENRLQLRSDYRSGPWSHQLAITLVGPRDLSEYGEYRNYFRSVASEPSGGEVGVLRKNMDAPAFVTIDTSVTYKINKTLSVVSGVTNLLDYTQAGRGDSPSNFHFHFDHFHYDGTHTWGPNRGREFFFKLTAEL
jgi:outer membrane cobalamin receptor